MKPSLQISVHSPYNDLILIKGSPYESPSVELGGVVDVRSTSDTFIAKRLVLKLIGVHKLSFHHLDHQSSHQQQQLVVVKEENTVFECKWDDLLSSPDGHITRQYKGDDTSSSSSSSSTPSTSSSHTNLFHLSNNSHNTPRHPISAGSHSFPFHIVLPGDLPETIEGLSPGSLLYRLEATLEPNNSSSSFTSMSISKSNGNITKHLYLRILRTLSTDTLLMSEMMSIGSTWPGKVQYEFSIPSKSIAIGTTTMIDILLVPLIKGIKLGPIKAQLVQQYLLKTVNTTTTSKQRHESFQESQVVVESVIREHEGLLLMDTTRLESELQIPSELFSVVPNCDLPGDIIKVRHKVKLQIELTNPDGHISELRTNLPVNLFISPTTSVKSRCVQLDQKSGKIYFKRENEVLFDTTTTSTSTSPITTPGSEALPSYESHVYDQLFTPIGSPVSESIPNSGISTPVPRLLQRRSHEHDDMDYFFSTNGTPTRTASPLLNNVHDHSLQLHTQLQKLSLNIDQLSQVPSYEEAIHTTPSSPTLPDIDSFAPEYHDTETDGISMTTSRIRRHTDQLSRPNEVQFHLHTNHLHSVSDSPVHTPSPLRSVASMTSLLLNKGDHQQYKVHSHSPLGGNGAGSTGARHSSTNLLRFMGRGP